jgi:hypothetical protein
MCTPALTFSTSASQNGAERVDSDYSGVGDGVTVLIKGQHKQKVTKTPISINKLLMLGCNCNHSY